MKSVPMWRPFLLLSSDTRRLAASILNVELAMRTATSFVRGDKKRRHRSFASSARNEQRNEQRDVECGRELRAA